MLVHITGSSRPFKYEGQNWFTDRDVHGYIGIIPSGTLKFLLTLMIVNEKTKFPPAESPVIKTFL